ncbi:centromere protein U isoform A [Alligator mississippiensis]|uniref:Centromere protein U n=1 Tax=Alligator mississippiensis TaxID=8496 RepID=A0A151PAX4_ALLMI|nr:centromere protein U isoform A [Alligator mississippiensis]
MLTASEKASRKKMERNRLRSKQDEHKSKKRPCKKLLPPDELDVSRILKVPETRQLEESDDSFDHPLHSTAVDADGDVELLEEENLEHDASSIHSPDSAPERKNTRGSKKQGCLKIPEDGAGKLEAESSEDEFSKENTIQKKKSEKSTKSHEKPKKKLSQKTALDPSDKVDSLHSVQVWCPKGIKRFSRDITELDVVLAKFEDITADYKERVESTICSRAIDGFLSGFKDQLTNTITEVQELKDLKRKNAKVLAEINKKRRRLMEIREELIGTEPKLKQLQKEYAELQERKSSFRITTQFITDLKELRKEYSDNREKHPLEKVTYGVSSLPALLIESRRILRAEKHFQKINKSLQQALDLQRQKPPEKL